MIITILIWFFEFILVEALLVDCPPDSSPYTIEITFQSNAATQAMEIYQRRNKTSAFVKSIYGYGKDNIVDTTDICLNNNMYKLVCYDLSLFTEELIYRSRNAWSDGSKFIVKVFGITTVMRGTLDIGKVAVFHLFPLNPIAPSDSWRYSDSVSQSDWIEDSFNDSSWDYSKSDLFYPIRSTRYYRISANISESRTVQHSAFELYIRHIGSINVYINGRHFLSQLSADNIPFESIKKGGVQQFIKSSKVVVAISVQLQPFENNITHNLTKDPFSTHMVFLSVRTPSSPNFKVTSDHQKDFYAHPVENLFDDRRKSSWWFRGQKAYVKLDFNGNLGEFVNQYIIGSGTDSWRSDPSSWKLFGSIDDINYTLLDSRSDETFEHRMHKKSYSLNSYPSTKNADNNVKTCLSMLSLTSSRVAIYDHLHYISSYIIYYQWERFHICPITSGYSHFRLLTILPPGLELDVVSGTLRGQVVVAFVAMNVTVEAVNMAHHEVSSATFLIESRECTPDRTIVSATKYNFDISSLEYWNLTTSDETYSNRGRNTYINETPQTEYYCLPKKPFDLLTFVTMQSLDIQLSLRKTSPGSIVIRIPFPSFSVKIQKSNQNYNVTDSNNGGMIPGALVKDMSFYAVAEMMFDETPRTCTVNPFLSIDDNTIWKAADWSAYNDRWYSMEYDDSTWINYSINSPYLRPNNVYLFRHWFDVQPLQLRYISSVEMKFRVSGIITVYFNEVMIYKNSLGSGIPWTTILFSSHSLTENRNLIAVKIEKEEKILKSDGIEPVAYALRFILRLSTESLCSSRSLDIKTTGDWVWPNYASNLLLNDMSRIWKCDFSRGKATAVFSLLYNSQHSMNQYCITNALNASQENPTSWNILAFSGMTEPSWKIVDEQRNIFWINDLETQCFIIPDFELTTRAIMWQVLPTVSQSFVRAAHISFYSVDMSHKEEVNLIYDERSISVYDGVIVKPFCPKYAFFSKYRVTPSLPLGLTISGGTGCLYGLVEVPFIGGNFNISAVSLDKKNHSTCIIINHSKCSYPSSYLSLTVNKKKNKESFSLVYTVFTSTWEELIVHSITSQTSTSTTVNLCLKPNSYIVSLSDTTGLGDLLMSYNLKQNSVIEATGLINPGFPQIWMSIRTCDVFDGLHTQWYYCVDECTPDTDWYKRIDPVWETWKVEIPAKIPKYSGISQFFKTVLFLKDLSNIILVDVTVKLRAGIVLYANGKELHRYNMPDGMISANTPAISKFNSVVSYSMQIPMQFSFFIEGRNVISIETHLMKTPSHEIESTFGVDIRLYSDRHSEMINATAVDMSDLKGDINKHSECCVSCINNGNYYDKYFRKSNCQNQFIHFFTPHGNIEYVSNIRLFVGNSKGAYPHNIRLYGRTLGSIGELNDAINGNYVENRKWVKLIDLEGINIVSNRYGVNKNMLFYNERSFNEFKFEFNDCDKAEGFEIAEIEFYSYHINGFCDIDYIHKSGELWGDSRRNTDYTDYIPSSTWYYEPCSEEYTGNMLYYCYNGNWTDISNQCKCKSPMLFEYPAQIVYVSVGKHISIIPKTKGAELFFFLMTDLPHGLYVNNKTGEIYGVLEFSTDIINIHVICANVEGLLETTLLMMTYNNYEPVLLFIAVLMVILFFTGLVFTIRTMKRKTSAIFVEKEKTKLHVDALSEEMRSFLL